MTTKKDMKHLKETINNKDLIPPIELHSFVVEQFSNLKDENLRDKICERFEEYYNTISEDSVSEMMISTLKKDQNLRGVRIFMSDTYDAELYALDGYGNLENITCDNVKMNALEVIDEFIEDYDFDEDEDEDEEDELEDE